MCPLFILGGSDFMDISKYALFADVANTGNFTKAENVWGTPSPVSVIS